MATKDPKSSKKIIQEYMWLVREVKENAAADKDVSVPDPTAFDTTTMAAVVENECCTTAAYLIDTDESVLVVALQRLQDAIDGGDPGEIIDAQRLVDYVTGRLEGVGEVYGSAC